MTGGTRAAVLLTLAHALLSSLAVFGSRYGGPPPLAIVGTSLLFFLVACRFLLARSAQATEPTATPPQPAAGPAPDVHPDAHLSEVLAHTRHMLYRFDPGHERYEYISKRAEDWLATPVDALCAPGGWLHFLRYLPPEELGRIWARIDDALLTPGHAPVEVDVEYRLDSPRQGQLWLHDAMTLLRKPDGSLAAIVGVVIDQTAQRATREYLSMTLRSIGEAVIATDEHCRVTLMNPVAEQMTGWPEEEARGRPLTEVLPLVHAEDGTTAECPAQRVMREGGKVTLPRGTLLVDRHGRQRPIADSGAPILAAPHKAPVGVVVVFRDASTEMDPFSIEAEQQLKAERDFSRGLIDSLPTPFFLFDEAGHLVLWNRFVRDLTGLDESQLVHREARQLVIQEQAPMMAHRLDTALQAGEASAEVLLQRNGRDPVPFLLVSRRVQLDGKPHVVSVGTDLTERKFAERAIKRLNAELEQRVAERTSQLSAALAELESFSYSVSHDLRTPLRAIEGYSTIIGTDYADRLDDEARELLRRVRAAAHRMSQLIDDLLTLSRVSRKPLERRQVDLSRLARAICDELQQQEPDRQISIDIAPCLQVEADPSLMRTVLENLLGNAWKFTGHTEQAEIQVAATHHDGHAAFVVRDNGAGFDMRYRDNLFRPFQRLHTDREFPGTGIGLATVARILHRHGGEVWAEGETGHGAAIYFALDKGSPQA
ncbi:PAS domain S-box protein [Zoogloea sp. LCSB751]|uniref:PAS domain-containing sensor histidine kinase n=1 Tax=Zoogloea sp. LCSB751 TaxID=1965277 RepID=UPI0009A5317B|nr:PAS domain S-box protein [Zoogloea sp. LCSB751]